MPRATPCYLWKFSASRSASTKKNLWIIYGSFMDIFDQTKREAQINLLWYFMPLLFVLPSPCTTLLREDRLRLGNKNESLLAFHFVLHSPCTTLLREDRLRLGNKNESLLAFHFVLHSPCTTLLREDRLRLGNTK